MGDPGGAVAAAEAVQGAGGGVRWQAEERSDEEEGAPGKQRGSAITGSIPIYCVLLIHCGKVCTFINKTVQALAQ